MDWRHVKETCQTGQSLVEAKSLGSAGKMLWLHCCWDDLEEWLLPKLATRPWEKKTSQRAQPFKRQRQWSQKFCKPLNETTSFDGFTSSSGIPDFVASCERNCPCSWYWIVFCVQKKKERSLNFPKPQSCVLGWRNEGWRPMHDSALFCLFSNHRVQCGDNRHFLARSEILKVKYFPCLEYDKIWMSSFYGRSKPSIWPIILFTY